MTKTHALRNRLAIMGCALLYGATAFAAGNQINITRTADPKGQVEVDNVSGSVEVIGWDRPEIDVSGTIGERVERVDLNVTGDHATVRVLGRRRLGKLGDPRPKAQRAARLRSQRQAQDP